MPVQAAPQPLTIIEEQRTFPAAARHVSDARRYLAQVMRASPAAGDAQICISELVTNAVQHSRSGSGGFFTVHVTRTAGTWRVSVGDEGGPWPDRHDDDGPGSRGLAIVAALSTRWQVDGDGLSGRVVWFEVSGR